MSADFESVPWQLKDVLVEKAKIEKCIAELEMCTAEIKELHAMADAIHAHGSTEDYYKVQAALADMLPAVLKESSTDK